MTFEIRKGAAPAVIATSQATLRATDLERRQVADGSLATRGLAPGDYIVSAVISVDGTPMGRVSRGVGIE